MPHPPPHVRREAVRPLPDFSARV
ncbi:MAG: hypothetical protein ACHQF3_02525 [Alphaproteobacteria bacterium]